MSVEKSSAALAWRSHSANAARPAKAPQQSPAQVEEPGQGNSRAEALLALSEQQNSFDHPLAFQSAQEALELWQTSADNAGMARAGIPI